MKVLLLRIVWCVCVCVCVCVCLCVFVYVSISVKNLYCFVSFWPANASRYFVPTSGSCLSMGERKNPLHPLVADALDSWTSWFEIFHILCPASAFFLTAFRFPKIALWLPCSWLCLQSQFHTETPLKTCTPLEEPPPWRPSLWSST